jgi:hypothetical protein
LKDIGWLVLSDKIITRQYTGAQQKKEVFAFQKEFGARVIMSQLETKYKINYVSEKQLDTYPYTFFSCVSWYDFFSLVVALKDKTPKTRLIIGGPGVGNIEHISDKVYAAVFGRCDYDPQEIIDGARRDNIAYGLHDSVIGIGQPEKLHVKEKEGQEKSFGCIKKCFFCEYGWRYKCLSTSDTNKYQSGPPLEDFIKHADFKSKRRVVTGLDGLTAHERNCVNKKLSHQEFADTLIRTDEAGGHVVLKLYSVVGLPCGRRDDFAEIRDAIDQAGAVKKQTLTVIFYTSHFVPMPCTPMEQERLIISSCPKIAPEQHGKIKLMTYLQGTGPASAALETALYRATGKEIGIFRQSIATDKFMKLDSRSRILAIKQLLPGILDEHDIPMPWLKRTFKLEKHKERYYNLKRGQYGI